MASLIALPFFFAFFSLSFSLSGEELYEKYCSSCHGKDCLGLTAPPLFYESLKKYSNEKLKRIIKKGIPATNMPAFPNLSEGEIKALISYIKSPIKTVKFTFEDVKKSYKKIKRKGKNYKIKEIRNIVVAVDKAEEIYILEGKRVLDSFEFKYVHGGVKFSLKNLKFYVPSRNGWIISYDLKKKKPFSKVRACVYLRNITLFPNESKVLATCILPKSAVILDKDLKPLKQVKLEGKPSAGYHLLKENKVLVAFKDIPKVALIDENGNVNYYEIKTPLDDFFIDPFGVFLIGSSRKSKRIHVYRISDFKEVFSYELESIPHLFSASFWYKDGRFFFATRHTDGSVSIWQMYNWKLLKVFKLNHKGFFVRTHFKNQYLWLDTFTNKYVLINKEIFSLEEREVLKNGKITHVEFSGDGKLAYFSVLGKSPHLLITDSFTLERIKKLPMKHPVGKYSIIQKTRKLYPALLGYEVYMKKCWGCHHTTRQAFGPSIKWIAKHRKESLILAQILNPGKTYKLLGYKENAMPKIELSSYEVEALLKFMEAVKDGWIN